MEQPIKFLDGVTFENGNKLFNFDYAPNGKYQFQTVRLFLPFGIGVLSFGGNKRYSIDAAFRGLEEPSIKKFYDNIHGIDENVKTYIKTHLEEMELTNLTPQDIDRMYQPSIKQTKYSPQFRLRVITQYNVIDTEFRDENDTFIDMSTPGDNKFKGYSAIFIIEFNSIVITHDKITASWKIIRGRVFPPKRFTGYQFLD